MTTPDDPVLGPEASPLVRPYVITNGRTLLSGEDLSLITLLTVAEGAPRSELLDPEKRRLIELCSGGYLSVAEIAGHTQLPVGIVRLLLSDLIDSGYLCTRKPIPSAELVDRRILEEVLHGLQARFG
ncbi:DUF742 domain-containing protein [Streptomyces sp. NPDC051286]|uniref:DUF742 domain-containing protein n=1 Tax=Streptomyces sp. NPDC051286 TaxID=3365647 RepID=UPI003792A24B